MSCFREKSSAGHFSCFACGKPPLSTCSNAPFCSKYSLLFCVCLCVAFCQIRVYCVEGQFFGDFMNSDPGSSLLSARNASVTIPKLSVNQEVHCSLWENEPGSNSVHIVVVCSSVALEENLVNGTLAALLAHSQSCRMKSTVELN